MDKKYKEKLKRLEKIYGTEWICNKIEESLARDLRLADSSITPSFVEVDNVEEANLVDLEIYRLVDYSRQGKYVFCRRLRK